VRNVVSALLTADLNGSISTKTQIPSQSTLPFCPDHRSTCKFPEALLGDVQRALGRFVSVRGKCFYRPGTAFLYRIDVWEMEVLPPSEELPSLSDLCGIAPDATGDKSSEQFVRELRDEWDRKNLC